MIALLSINVNKFALLRNARETNHPDLIEISDRCIKYGAQGITVHPRPDERHVKFSDLPLLSKLIKNQDQKIEFNIEGYPSDKFCKIVKEIKPDQVTLVPDPPDALTSSFGWDCLKYKTLLIDVIKYFQQNNIRVSLFINPSIESLIYLNEILPDRVELYTFDFAKNFNHDQVEAIEPYLKIVKFLQQNIPSISFNAGHDLNLKNLNFLLTKIPIIKEVSIGHALVCDTFEYGLNDTIQKYLTITKR